MEKFKYFIMKFFINSNSIIFYRKFVVCVTIFNINFNYAFIFVNKLNGIA